MAEREEFEKALKIVLRNEGGYVNDSDDPGGETNLGITAGTLATAKKKRIVDASTTVKGLTRTDAEKIYYAMYWQGSGANYLCWPCNMVVFDTAVNCGNKTAIKILQRAINNCSKTELTEDGVFGIRTGMAFEEAKYYCGLNSLVITMSVERLKYYDSLVSKNNKLKKFLNGWAARVNYVREVAFRNVGNTR